MQGLKATTLRPPMSALGHKRTFCIARAMSALPPIATAKADIVHSNSCPLWARSGHDYMSVPLGAKGVGRLKTSTDSAHR
jgi:hypothetical protein